MFVSLPWRINKVDSLAQNTDGGIRYRTILSTNKLLKSRRSLYIKEMYDKLKLEPNDIGLTLNSALFKYEDESL